MMQIVAFLQSTCLTCFYFHLYYRYISTSMWNQFYLTARTLVKMGLKGQCHKVFRSRIYCIKKLLLVLFDVRKFVHIFSKIFELTSDSPIPKVGVISRSMFSNIRDTPEVENLVKLSLLLKFIDDFQ